MEMYALANAVQVDYWNLRHSETLSNALKVSELAGKVDAPFSEFVARYYSGNALRLHGDLDGARSHAEVSLILAERLRDRWSLAGALSVNQNVSQSVGDWTTAREFSSRALSLYPEDPRLLGLRTQLEYLVGDLAEGKEFMERLLEVMRLNVPAPNNAYVLPAITIPLVALTVGDVEWLDVAAEAVEVILSSASANPLAASSARVSQALLAILQGDSTTASREYSVLESRRGALLGPYSMNADRLLGLLCQSIGNLDQAVSHFEEALSFCRKAGYGPELAWTCCEYADCLRQRNGDGDRAKAMSQLDESLAISIELGMRPLRERVEARLEGLDARASRTPKYISGLSQREVEVLRLVAAGKTDREIAEELYISFRTVGNHLRNILNKTGTINRTEAATFAAQQGLLDSS